MLCGWLFFRRSKYYFGEHMAINSFAMAYLNVFYILIFPLELHTTFGVGFYYLFSVVFLAWLYFKTHNRKGFSGFLYSTLSVILIYFIYVIIILSIIFLYVINHIDLLQAAPSP